MFYYTSFYRHRDNTGKIIGYTLRNEQTLEWMQVTPEQLKDAIYYKRVHVFNLKLTSDGRLIEAANPLNKHCNIGRLNQENQKLSNVNMKNADDNISCTEIQKREQIFKDRVKFDGPFELNKLIRFFTGRRQGRVKNFGGDWDDYNDSDNDGIIGDDD